MILSITGISSKLPILYLKRGVVAEGMSPYSEF